MEKITHQIWACEESALVDYLSRREDVNPLELEGKGSLLDLFAVKEESILSISGGVATIAINGVLTKEGPDLISRILGFAGTSYADIEAAINTAVENQDVKKIQLLIDSPGGEVAGVDEVRGAIARAAKDKEVVAINTGMVASAAYWLASAASDIISTSPANLTGSIGVVAVAIDRSERDAKWGRVTVVSRNAPDKRPNLQTESGIAVIQDQVDALERTFIARISEGRGITADQVAQTFGRGRVMVAVDADESKPSALSVGMIDRVVDGFALKAQGQEATQEREVIAEAIEENVLPPCAAGGNDMSQELQAQVAELTKQLGDTVAAQDELKARMTAVAPILSSDVYPAVIKEIAGKVLSGQEHHKTLEGAVAVFDAQHAKEQIEQAETAAKEAPVPEPKAAGVPADGSIVSAESLDAQVKSMRAMLGKE